MFLNSKIVALLLSLVFIFGIGVVSANGDLGSNVTLSESIDDVGYVTAVSTDNVDTAVENSPIIDECNESTTAINGSGGADDCVLGSSVNDNGGEILGATGTFSDLKALIDSAPAGSILNLTMDYKYNNASDFSLLDGIIINKKLTIDGKGLYSVEGQTNMGVRLFRVQSADVTFQNMTFKNGYRLRNAANGHHGGAIWYNSNCKNATLINCIFTGNRVFEADDYDAVGGSIYWQGKDGFNVTNCNFSCASNVVAARRGGAIYTEGSNVFISYSVFNSLRTEDSYGTGIYMAGASYVNATIWNCTFSNATNTNIYGAVYSQSSENITIFNNTFYNHYSRYGLIYLRGGTHISIYNNTFNKINAYGEACIRICDVASDDVYIGHNSFTNMGTGGGYRLISLNAGGVNIYSGNATIEYNNFTNINLINSAITASVIDVTGSFECVNIYNNNFTNTTSRTIGVIKTVSPTYIVNNTFNDYYLAASDGSTAVLKGMAIWASNYTYIKNNTFIGGSYNASKVPNSAEGVIYIDDTGTGIIDNNTFINNNFTSSILSHMGVISNHGNGTIIMNNILYDSDCTGALGGFIYNTGCNVEIYNNNFSNTVAKSGGAIYSSGENVYIHNNNIADIYADEAGGFYIVGKNTNVSENTFEDINAINYGVIYCSNAEGSLFYKNNYTNNYAVSQGIVAIGSNVTLTKDSFVNNNMTNGLAGNILIMGDNNILNDISIINSSANTGGAIYNMGINNHLNNVNITNTSAVSGYGGAIYSLGDYLDIDGLFVQYSNAAIDGGAVYNDGANGKLSNAIFKYVNATNNGGVIFWSGANGNISHINISDSFTGGDGGAIYWSGSYGVMSDVNVRNVYAITGGAVYCVGSNCNLVNSHFDNIRAVSDGGAVYWAGSAANLTGIIFNNVNSSANGGAIYGTGMNSFLDDLNFSDINASSSGGAVYWTGADSTLSNLNFINVISYAKGGALYFTGDRSRFIKGSFRHIHAVDNGGAVYWTGSSSSMEGIAFIDCISDDMGGAIYWTGSGCNVTSSKFIDNYAASGGAVYWAADNGKLLYSNFSDNTAEVNGGAVYWIGNDAELDHLNLSNNSALFKGGAINIIGNNNKFGFIFAQDNNASVDGGAIILDGLNCILSNSEFINNSAVTNGGALYWGGVNGTLTSTNFNDNRGGIGGAIYWSADGADISEVNFNGNNASTAGALYMGGLSGGKLVDGVFINNNASMTGGAIYWTGSKGILLDCSFDGASARDGGAIYWAGSDSVLDCLDMVHVYARENGGMLYVSSSNVTVSNSDFYGSNATTGGAIYWTGSEGALTNNVFENNSAKNYGGAVYWIGNNAALTNVNFTNNSAGIDGGALYIISYGAVLDKLNFFNNTADKYGGALYWAGTGNISDFEFRYNKAFSGSAIYNAGTLNLKSGVILQNKANISSIDIIESETNIAMTVTTVIHGLDNFLNGIWTTSSNIQVYDITYYGAGVVDHTPVRWVTPKNGFSSTDLFYDTRVAGVPANVSFKRSGVEALNFSGITGIGGNFSYTCTKIPYGDYDVEVIHIDDDYYYGKEYNEVVYVDVIIPDLEVSLNTTEFYYDTSVLIRANVVAKGSDGNAITVWGKSDIYVDDVPINLTLNIVDGWAEYAGVLPPEFGIGIHNITGNFYEGIDKDGNPVDPIERSDAFYFTIVKNFLPTVVDISLSTPVVYVDEEVNITIKGPTAYTGNITYVAGNVNGTTKFDENGTFVVTTSYPVNSTVNVLVYVEGDDNYLPSSASYSFDVIRRNFTISLDYSDSINVSDSAFINITLNESDVTGSITVSVDGERYEAAINQSNAQIFIDNLGYGVHDISVSYDGNSRYNPVSPVNGTITVSKVNIDSISVVADNPVIYVGDAVVLTISINSTDPSKYPVNGYVIVGIDGSYYNAYIEDNVGHLTVYNLSNNTHDVSVVYSGDNQFNDKSVLVEDVVAVNKIDTAISVSPVNPVIVVGDYVLFDITVNPDKYTVNGHVIVKVNDTEYDVSISNNKGLLNVSNLGYSSTPYDVNITYGGDNQFNAANVSTQIVVNSEDISSINVKVENGVIYVGDDVLLNVTVRSGKYSLNGVIVLSVAGVDHKVSISDGKGYLVVPGLPYIGQDYIVDAYFAGDDQFSEYTESNVAAFNVKKVDIEDITLDVVASPIYVGDDAVFNINISSKVPDRFDVNGFVNVVVDNKDYNVSIVNGKGNLVVTGLNEGNYSIYVSYDGDDTFNRFNKYSSTSINNVVVNKKATDLSMSDVEISVGNVAVIVARLSEANATGSIVFIVDDKEYVSGIVDGVGVVNVYGLNASANSTITAIYSGDAKFANSSCTADLIVNKVTDSISISVYNITAGESEVVVIVLPADLSNGTINVKFNGSVLTPNKYNINNNVITFNRTISAAGVYDVEVSVKDDAKYYNMESSDSFTVSSVEDYDISVSVDDVVLGQSAKVKVSLPSDATLGTVVINGANYTVREASRGVVLPVADGAGVYDVNVSYVGDFKYANNSVLVNYTVLKADSRVYLNMSDVFYVGDSISFIVTTVNSTGNISVSINGIVYNPKNATKFVIPDELPSSNYTVIVKLDADDNYNGADVSKVIRVIKKDVSVTLDNINSPVRVGDDVVITVKFNESVTGNVILNIAGTNYTVGVNGRSASYAYEPLLSGNYSVSAYYAGSDIFNSNATGVSSFIVNRNPISLTVNADSIHVGQDARIDVSLSNDQATGTVNVSVNNKNYIVVLENGQGTVYVSGLTTTTNNTINAFYNGNEMYESSSAVSSVDVSKVDISSISVEPDEQSIYVGRDAELNINIAAAVSGYIVNGYVTVFVNDTQYNVSISNGRGSLSVPNLAYGKYSVSVIYDGDFMYNSKSASTVAVINVKKVDISSISVKPTSQFIFVGGSAKLDINMTAGIDTYVVNGYVTVIINDTQFNVSITNGLGSLNVSDFDAGIYKVSVVYNGDSTYNSKSVSNVASITVSKIPVSISMLPLTQSIYVGDDAKLNISVTPDIDGYLVNNYVTVFVNDTSYDVYIANGTGKLSVPGLLNGTYNVKIIFDGNRFYNNASYQKANAIAVNKIPTKITMDNVSLKVGEDAIIVAVVNNTEVTGNVTFIVDNKNYTVGIISGVARLNVTGLNTSANKTITARYSGDYKYINSTATALLNITKVYSNASIIVYNITAGDTETVIINLPIDVSNGTVIVKFNDIVIDDYVIANNVISFNRTLQVSGNYSVAVSVKDDCKYYDFANSTVFTVFKVAPGNYTIHIDVNNTKVFEEIPIIVNLPNDANETLLLMVDNETIGNISVNNGVASRTLGNLSSGNHTITVTYGNDKYDTKTVSADVFVSKIASCINITVPVDPRVAHDIIINVTPEARSTGNITVTINGKEYAVEDRSIVNASDLLEGNYTVVAVLAEDDNFFESTSNVVFTVKRNPVSMTLDNVTGEVRVNHPIVLRVDLTENVTGSVVFNINGENFTVNITESNIAEYVWIPAADGVATISASYLGSYIYYPNSTDEIVFDVYKNPIKFNYITVENIMVDDTEHIIVSLNESDATGIITINVNGSSYEATIADGSASFNVSGIPAGSYKVIASYGGDFKYLATNSISDEFIVSKYDAPVIITAEDIMVLDDALVIVNVPDDASGYISVTVNGKSVHLPVVDGSVSLNISNLSAGVYEVSAEYSGDYKYLANSSIGSFNVIKYNSTFDIVRDDEGWTGEDINMSVKLSDDATGNVTLSINGTDYVLPVVEGKVDFTTPMLDAGDYEVTISYSGDYKYDNVSDTFNFTVNSNHPILESSDVVKYYKGSERLYINLTNVRGDKLAGETIYITVNGITYTRVVNDNGMCSIPINLPTGEYEVVIVYNESDLYDPITKVVNATVLATVTADDLVKVFCNDSQYWAHFTDSNGNDLVNTSIKFNINGVFYTRTTNSEGWAKLNINLPHGEYIITAYNPVTDEKCSSNITVLPRIVENEDLVKVYRDPSKFTVRVIGDDGAPVSEGVSVSFNINGVIYTRSTNSSGYASLNINLPEGEYIITSSYLGSTVSNTVTVLAKD